MTSLTSYFLSSIKSVYNNINPSTLTGAIDVIVVQQDDGTLRCTPFHVRFGKLGVLRNQKNKVYIMINGNPVEDLYMELGEAGEAVFVEEDNGNRSLSPIRLLEPSDSNIFLDPIGAVLADSQLSSPSANGSPVSIDKDPDEQKVNETNETASKYAYEQPSVTSVENDVLESTVVESKRRRPKRRFNMRIDRTNEDINEDEDQEIKKILSSAKENSRARKRASTAVSMNDNATNDANGDQQSSSLAISRQHSASENDLLLFQIDDEKQSTSSTPFVDAHSRMNSIDSRRKLLIIPPKTSDGSDSDGEESYSSSLEDSGEDVDAYRRNTRGLSNPIPIEPKPSNEDASVPTDESNSLVDTGFSQSVPITNNGSVPLRMTQSNDSASFYLNEGFLPTSSFDNSIPIRPESPKSDTEYELDKSSQQSARNTRTGFLWRWKWGELPEQRRSVFRYLWPSSSTTPKTTTPKEGIYLDDITNNKCDDRSRYLPQMDYQNRSRTPKDDDQESGTGNSIPQSPVRDFESSYLLGDVQLSLCGNLDKLESITDDLFNAHLISYEKFARNPSIINDQNLVVRISGKCYSWNVASALIASANVYHKQLPPHIVDTLQDKPTAPSTSRTSSGISLWPFSGKNSNKKTLPVESAAVAEALAVVVKSEVVPTMLQNQSVPRNSASHENDQEDQEVKKIMDKLQQQQQQSAPIRPSILKRKTMTLTSEQLKRLNLRNGPNQIEFSVTTALQGTTVVQAHIFLFDHTTKFVISDIDGTITKSDVFGHILPWLGKDWSHDGIAEFFQAIRENGYQFLYLSARAIGQGQITRSFLRSVTQCGYELPVGPLLISPDTLFAALYREVIARRPEEFKIECLKNIGSLFPNNNPFYAGFGNRLNDQSAYTAVGIPETRIFTINPRGEVVRQKISQVLCTSYKNLHEVVDQIFPPMDSFSASECYSSFTFWREPPKTEDFEDEMRLQLEDMAKRQKTKGGKGALTGVSSKVTPTTTVIKPSGEKLLSIAQATENTVKKA